MRQDALSFFSVTAEEEPASVRCLRRSETGLRPNMTRGISVKAWWFGWEGVTMAAGCRGQGGSAGDFFGTTFDNAGMRVNVN